MNGSAPQAAWTGAMRRRIGLALEAAFAARPQTEVLRAARYVTQGAGHRWRGLAAVAAGGLFRGDAEACALPLAAALEMMHAASLALDDLPSMDGARTRRGKACAHRAFAGWTMDLLPAYLVNLAYHVAADNPLAPEACRIRSLVALGEMGTRLACGQEGDLALARERVSGDELLACYALKSGAPFAAALEGGALLCGAGPSDAAALREAGVELGQAYQILDDMADGPEEAGRCTALTLFGAEGARARAERLLAEAEARLGRFGAAAGRLREVLGEILPRAGAPGRQRPE